MVEVVDEVCGRCLEVVRKVVDVVLKAVDVVVRLCTEGSGGCA